MNRTMLRIAIIGGLCLILGACGDDDAEMTDLSEQMTLRFRSDHTGVEETAGDAPGAQSAEAGGDGKPRPCGQRLQTSSALRRC